MVAQLTAPTVVYINGELLGTLQPVASPGFHVYVLQAPMRHLHLVYGRSQQRFPQQALQFVSQGPAPGPAGMVPACGGTSIPRAALQDHLANGRHVGACEASGPCHAVRSVAISVDAVQPVLLVWGSHATWTASPIVQHYQDEGVPHWVVPSESLTDRVCYVGRVERSEGPASIPSTVQLVQLVLLDG